MSVTSHSRRRFCYSKMRRPEDRCQHVYLPVFQSTPATVRLNPRKLSVCLNSHTELFLTLPPQEGKPVLTSSHRQKLTTQRDDSPQVQDHGPAPGSGSASHAVLWWTGSVGRQLQTRTPWSCGPPEAMWKSLLLISVRPEHKEVRWVETVGGDSNTTLQEETLPWL